MVKISFFPNVIYDCTGMIIQILVDVNKDGCEKYVISFSNSGCYELVLDFPEFQKKTTKFSKKRGSH